MYIQRSAFILFYLLVGSLFLSGCFVLKANVDWSHTTSRTNLDNDSVLQPQIGVTLSRRLRFLFLPFVLVLYDTKGYRANFNFANEKDFGRIDSVNLSFYHNDGSLFTINKIKPDVNYSAKNIAEYDKSINSQFKGMYFANFDLRLGNENMNKKDEYVIFNYHISTTTQSGKVQVYHCDSCKLEREGKHFKFIVP